MSGMSSIVFVYHFFDSSFFFSLFIRLYTTIVRYDPVYYVHFKCNFGLSTFTLTRIMRQGSLFFFFSHCQSDTIIPICTSGSSVSTGIIRLSRILPTLTVRLCVSAYDYELKIILLFLFSQISRSIITTLTLKSTPTASFPLDPMSISSLSSKSRKEKVKNK